MSVATELASLYRRDLVRLVQEVKAFPDEASFWKKAEGMNNTAGNLALHLEGNLREYVGRQLGGVAYERTRPLEFSSTGLPVAEVTQRLEQLAELIPGILAALTAEELEATFPEKMPGGEVSTRQHLIHLLGHLNYHLGQIDCIRRTQTGGGVIDFVR